MLAAGGTVALAVESPANPPTPSTIPIAHSALLTIFGVVTSDGLALHIQHAGNQIPIDGRDVTVSVDGKSQPVTAEPEGTFVLSTKDLNGDGERQLDIVVAHDGIREILSGKVTLPKTGSTLDLWRDHKQMAWWSSISAWSSSRSWLFRAARRSLRRKTTRTSEPDPVL